MFEWDKNGFMEMVRNIMAAPKGTLAYEVRNEWAMLALEMNIDKLYESAE